jgi:hypothetical protein
MSKIFGAAPSSGQTAPTQPAAGAGQPEAGAASGTQTAPSVPSTSATAGAGAKPSSAGATAPTKQVDVAATLDALTAKNSEKLDWKRSIVDLMKLVGMDSSLAARKELADDLHYTGDKNDSASMNIWLHKEVLKKLAENGGKVPQDLLNK